MLETQCGKRFADFVAVLSISCPPRLGVPYLDLVDDPDMITMSSGDQHAALFVEIALRGRGKEKPHEVLDLFFHRREGPDLLLQLFPFLERIDREALVIVHGKHE